MKCAYFKFGLIILISSNSFANDNYGVHESKVVYGVSLDRKGEGEIDIDADSISSNLILDEEDLVRNEPGISISNKGRDGSSGFNMRGVEEDRISINVDGVKQGESFNNEIFGVYGYTNSSINGFEIDLLKRVKINKGSDSFFYGSGSIGGSVSLETKDVDDIIYNNDNFGIYNKSSFSSFNNGKKNTLGIGLKNDRFGLLLIHSTSKNNESKLIKKGNELVPEYDDKGNRNKRAGQQIRGVNRGASDPLTKKKEATLIKLNYYPDDSSIFELGYDHYESEVKVDEWSWDILTHLRRETNLSSERDKYSISYKFEPNKKTKNQLQVYHQSINQGNIASKFQLKDEEWVETFDRTISQKSYGIGLDGQHLLETNLVDANIYYGFNFDKKEYQSTNYELTFDSRPIDKKQLAKPFFNPIKSSNYNFLFGYDFNVNDNVEWFAGIRYDKFKNKATNKKGIKFDAITYSTTIDWSITDEFMLSYSINSGFRAPTANEMYFEFNSQGFFQGDINIVSNPDLMEEHSLTHELELLYFDGIIEAKVTPYYTSYDNFITLSREVVSKRDRNNKVVSQVQYVYDNVESAYVYGVGGDIKYDIGERFNLNNYMFVDDLYYRFNFNYEKGMKKDESILEIQPWEFSNQIQYKYDDYKIKLVSKYVSKKKKNDTKFRKNRNDEKPVSQEYLGDSYLIFDVLGSYNFNKYMTLSGGIFNITNERYITWDSIRNGYRRSNISAMPFGENGESLNRYTSPGVNFKVGLELRY